MWEKPLRTEGHGPGVLVRVAAWSEQKIRAHPGLHSAFFAVIGKNALARRLAGTVKGRVRASGSRHAPASDLLHELDEAVRARREQSLAVRLGLDRAEDP